MRWDLRLNIEKPRGSVKRRARPARQLEQVL